jgi:hypothetical protein
MGARSLLVHTSLLVETRLLIEMVQSADSP